MLAAVLQTVAVVGPVTDTVGRVFAVTRTLLPVLLVHPAVPDAAVRLTLKGLAGQVVPPRWHTTDKLLVRAGTAQRHSRSRDQVQC